MAKQYRATNQDDRIDMVDGVPVASIAWDIWGLDDNGDIIPGRHKTVVTPAVETRTAIETSAAAVVTLLVQCAGPGWDNEGFDEAIAQEAAKQTALALAATVSAEVQAFVDGIGGFPKEFNI